MSHPHTSGLHSNSSGGVQLSDIAQACDLLESKHSGEYLVGSKSPQATPGSHNLEKINIESPNNQILYTTAPADIIGEGKTIPQSLAADSLPDLPPSNQYIKSRQPNTNLDEVSGFWEGFNNSADLEDREFVKVLAGNLDSLLTFAGLFSGVVTAFIIESIKTIQPDQAQKTNDLIRSVLMVLQNSTVEHTLHDEPFVPTHQHIRCTIVFFTSLCCSLSAAFGAVLGKQWLNHYEKEGVLKPPPSRGRERQKKYEGRSYWHMEGIIETLPTILQISLFLFLIALVDFMFPVNITVAYVVMGFSLAPALLYMVTTTIATRHPLSPFQTRLAITIRSTPKVPGYLLDLLKDMNQYPWQELAWRMRWIADWADGEPPLRQLGVLLMVIMIPLVPLLCILWRVITLLPAKLWSIVIEGTTLPDTILDLKCLIFYAERATSSGALARVIEAIGTVPPNLEVDKGHPIVTPFCEMLFKFVIKPNSSVTMVGEYTSKLINADFRQLLNALRFLYTTWLHSDNPFTNKQMALYLRDHRRLTAKGLCTIFSQESENIGTTSLIADILEVMSVVNDEPTGINQALVLEYLQSPSLGDADSLPYISLLFTNSIVQQHLSNPIEVEAPIRRLHSTMWINGQLDLNYTRIKIRAQVLSECLGETEDDLRFSLYLAKCCEIFLPMKEQAASRSLFANQYRAACSHSLAAIFSLLHRDKSTRWLQQLETDGIPSILMQFVRQDWNGNHQCIALFGFVSFWHRRRGSDSPGEMVDGTFQLYLTPHALESVASNLEAVYGVNFHDEPHRHLKTSEIVLGLELVVEYFEAASQSGLLMKSMKFPAGYFEMMAVLHPELTIEFLERMKERVDKLVFN